MGFGAVIEILAVMQSDFKQKHAELWEVVGALRFKQGQRKRFGPRHKKNLDYSTLPLSFSACDVKWIKLNYKEFQVKAWKKKSKEMAQWGRIKPWVIAGQDWTAAPERFGHGSVYTELQRKDPKGRRTLWTPLNLQQAVIHHHPVETGGEGDAMLRSMEPQRKEDTERGEVDEVKRRGKLFITAW